MGQVIEKRRKIFEGMRKEKQFVWKQKIEEKIPQKLADSLKSAFGKAFFMMFERETVVEKTISNDLVLEYDAKLNLRMQKDTNKTILEKIETKGG